MNEHELIGSAVTAWMGSKFIEILKVLPFTPWINRSSEHLNKWVSRFIALATTLGIHASFGDGTLTITGLTWIGMGNMLLEYARQYMFQEIAYKKFVREQK